MEVIDHILLVAEDYLVKIENDEWLNITLFLEGLQEMQLMVIAMSIGQHLEM